MKAEHLPTSDYLAHFRNYIDTEKYLSTPPTQIQVKCKNRHSYIFLLVKLILCKPRHFPNLFLLEIELLHRFVQLLCNGKQPHSQSLSFCKGSFLYIPFYIYKMRLFLSDLVYLSLSSTKELFHWHRSSNRNEMVPIWREQVVPRFVLIQRT